jgi:hypothetical protein
MFEILFSGYVLQIARKLRVIFIIVTIKYSMRDLNGRISYTPDYFSIKRHVYYSKCAML